MPRRPRPRTLLGVLVVLGLVAAAAGCGSGSGALPSDAGGTPAPPDPSGGDHPSTTPPPSPPRPPVFDPDAYVHQRVVPFGGFPSDVLRRGQTVFTSDGDQMGALGAVVVPVDVSGPVPRDSGAYQPAVVLPTHLRDSNGQPADVRNPIGFGFFLNDIEVVNERLGLVLVNAGGSDSVPALANLVAFDPTTGLILQTVDLANPYVPAAGATDSTGAAVPPAGFVQAGAEALAWTMPSGDRGLLFVAMTNLVFGAPSYGTTKYPGTVQVFDLVAGAPDPVRARPEPGRVTETIDVGGFNPVALQRHEVDGVTGAPPAPARLLVTVAGATATDAAGKLVPTTPASVVAYEAGTRRLLHRFPLGLVGLSATRPAVGRDAAGHTVGFYPSAVTGEVYLLLLDGLRTPVVDPSRLAVLRGRANGIPIAPGQRGGPGGNVTGVGLAPDGRTLVVAGFGDLFATPAPLPGRLYLLNLPPDVVTGSGFGTDFVPGATLYGTAAGRTLGALVVVPNDGSRPDVFVAVSSPFDPATFMATGPASLGSLQTFGLFR